MCSYISSRVYRDGGNCKTTAQYVTMNVCVALTTTLNYSRILVAEEDQLRLDPSWTTRAHPTNTQGDFRLWCTLIATFEAPTAALQYVLTHCQISQKRPAGDYKSTGQAYSEDCHIEMLNSKDIRYKGYTVGYRYLAPAPFQNSCDLLQAKTCYAAEKKRKSARPSMF